MLTHGARREMCRLVGEEGRSVAEVPLCGVSWDTRVADLTYQGMVEMEWFLPGWSSNWSQEADRVEAAYSRADVLVLLRLVRTEPRKAAASYCRRTGRCTLSGRLPLSASTEAVG